MHIPLKTTHLKRFGDSVNNCIFFEFLLYLVKKSIVFIIEGVQASFKLPEFQCYMSTFDHLNNRNFTKQAFIRSFGVTVKRHTKKLGD